jgi:alkyl hydroperoxide reductase subunit AhpF
LNAKDSRLNNIYMDLEVKNHFYDVLVVGSGGCGLAATIFCS